MIAILPAGLSVGARGPRAWLDRLVPPACVLCHRGLAPGGPPLCAPCRHRLPPLPPPWCSRCGAPAAGAEAACPECEGWPDDRPRCAAAYPMAGAPARLVRALKYGGWQSLAEPMGEAMLPAALRLAEGANRTPLLVPVPLSPARRRERGFNQAELLAAHVGRAAGWPARIVLGRRRTGRRQARSGRRDRALNVRDLFFPIADAAAWARGRPTILVDDVVTTGATTAACASALRDAGSSPVGVVSFARALHALEALSAVPYTR